MTVGIISHYLCASHEMGKLHPESPARLSAIKDQLIRSGLDFAIRQYEANPIEPELLSLVHDPEYINYIFDNAPTEGIFRLDPDTLMNPYTLKAVLHAAGAAVQAVDLVMSKELTAAFCAIRPPGHHAEKNRAMGFCFFNNIAIAAAYARKQYNLKKVAILDFDVHHGNGTEDIFTGQPDVLFCSTFQHPFYPFSGTGKTPPNIINTPLDATASSEEFQKAVNDNWLPALEEFKPEMLFISAGFDAHAEDEMSHIRLYEPDYRWVTDKLRAIADQHCEGRIVSVLEGGYDLSALGRSVVAHVNGLIGN
jgi:acetoin utilization deacetylase AcuC-like enzyme